MGLFDKKQERTDDKEVVNPTYEERLTRLTTRITDLEGRMLNVEADADNFRNKVLRKIQRRREEEVVTDDEKPKASAGSPLRR